MIFSTSSFFSSFSSPSFLFLSLVCSADDDEALAGSDDDDDDFLSVLVEPVFLSSFKFIFARSLCSLPSDGTLLAGLVGSLSGG